MSDFDRYLLYVAAWFNWVVDLVVWAVKVFHTKIFTVDARMTATVILCVAILVYLAVVVLDWSALR